MKYCHRPHLVNTNFPMSQHALSEEEIKKDAVKGCSNLECLACGKKIKYWDHKRWEIGQTLIFVTRPTPEFLKSYRNLSERIQEVYDEIITPDLVDSQHTRAYACRCMRYSVVTYENLYYEISSLSQWCCKGHPE